jgi:hypothetical protein
MIDARPPTVASLSKEELFKRFLLIKNDPIEFAKCVRTLDEADKNESIKPFPWEMEYFQFYMRCLQKMDLVAIPKSRRMKMSWSTIIFIVWDAMFHQGRHWAMVSKKEDDSDELVKRAKFIVENLDHSKLPRELLPRMEYKFCEMSFPEINSRISGYPSGADQLRQFTLSGIMGDECAFWSNAREMYKAAKPTLEGGGKMILISSPAPGFFKNLVFDQLDNEKEFDPEELMLGRKKTPMTGLNLWVNPNNKFFIFELHYTADPLKRSTEWKMRAKAGMTLRDWNQEYELMWDSFSGLPVYGEWNKGIHVGRDLEPQAGLPLLRGWDFGLTPACIVAQLQGSQLVILHEFTEFNMGADRFSDIVLPQCHSLFPGWGSKDWIDFVDPAGVNRDQGNDASSCVIVLDSKGLNCIPGAITFSERRKAVEKLLITFTKEGPAFQIASHCSKLIKGFNGGYQFPEGVIEKEPGQLKPIKNEYSHPHDALQYICTGIQGQRKKSSSRLPQISYTSTNRR